MKLPKRIFVYVCDSIDGDLVYAATESIEELPDNLDLGSVGDYQLLQEYKLKLSRALIPNYKSLKK